MPTKKERTPKGQPKLAKASINPSKRHADFEYGKHILSGVEKTLWAAVFDGDFRIAVRCRRCKRWLVDGKSKRRHYGAVCAAEAAADGGDR